MLFFLGNKKKPNLFHFFIKVQIISKENKKLQLICIASFTEIHGDPAIKICVEETEQMVSCSCDSSFHTVECKKSRISPWSIGEMAQIGSHPCCLGLAMLWSKLGYIPWQLALLWCLMVPPEVYFVFLRFFSSKCLKQHEKCVAGHQRCVFVVQSNVHAGCYSMCYPGSSAALWKEGTVKTSAGSSAT